MIDEKLHEIRVNHICEGLTARKMLNLPIFLIKKIYQEAMVMEKGECTDEDMRCFNIIFSASRFLGSNNGDENE